MTQGRGHVALVGLSGTGKSTLAPLLAGRRGMRSVDLDHEVAARTGRTVAEVFATEGEAAFRQLESEALRTALEGPPAVLATGGGVVLDPGNRVLLAERATVVWLQAAPGELVERLAAATEERPLLAGGNAAAATRLAEMADVRSPLYESVADAALSVDGRDPADVVDALDALLDDLVDLRASQ